jgi:YD repeat-containing protein
MAAVCARERAGSTHPGRAKERVARRLAGGCIAACVVLVWPLCHADDIAYGYDAVGRLVSVTVGGNSAYYDYDAAGNITAIRRQGNVSAASGNTSATQAEAILPVASNPSVAR